MTLDEALAKGHARLDEIAEQILTDTEDVLRHHGATDEEVGIELDRVRQELSIVRSRMIATIVCGWESHSTWAH